MFDTYKAGHSYSLPPGKEVSPPYQKVNIATKQNLIIFILPLYHLQWNILLEDCGEASNNPKNQNFKSNTANDK